MKLLFWEVWMQFYCTLGNFRIKVINFRIARKFLKFMKINSLPFNFPGLEYTVKHSHLWKLVAFETPKSSVHEIVSFWKFPGLQYIKFWILNTGIVLAFVASSFYYGYHKRRHALWWILFLIIDCCSKIGRQLCLAAVKKYKIKELSDCLYLMNANSCSRCQKTRSNLITNVTGIHFRTFELKFLHVNKFYN